MSLLKRLFGKRSAEPQYATDSVEINGEKLRLRFFAHASIAIEYGGRWIYVVDASGEKAYRREIRIGRQNPQYYEVIEGLQVGEKVITSSYDNFGENEVLILNR